jgi:hypothetical protein
MAVSLLARRLAARHASPSKPRRRPRPDHARDWGPISPLAAGVVKRALAPAVEKKEGSVYTCRQFGDD